MTYQQGFATKGIFIALFIGCIVASTIAMIALTWVCQAAQNYQLLIALAHQRENKTMIPSGMISNLSNECTTPYLN
jgi:hypothetical protein